MVSHTLHYMLHSTAHSLIWVLGIIYGIVPLLTAHKFGSGMVELYPVDEYFSMRIIVLLALANVGSLIWSMNVKLLKKTDQLYSQKSIWLFTILGAEILLIVLGLLGLVTGYAYFVVGILVNIIFFCRNLSYLKNKEDFSNHFNRFYRWLSKRNNWNAIFYLFVLLILITHNSLLIVALDGVDVWHKLSLFFNRFFNQFALIALMYLIIQSSLYVAPRWSRAVIWVLSSIVPLLIISDYYTHTLWNSSFLSLINSTGIEGFLDPENALKGGGIKTPIVYLALMLVAAFVVLFLVVWVCNALSRRYNFKISPRTAIFVAMISILGATVEQSVGRLWKDKRDLAVEAAEFDLQMSMVRTPSIIVEFEVEFRDHLDLQQDVPLTLRRKPDVYFIFIESFRADALTAEIAPNLYKFQQEDAQEIERAWSVSNGTHLSWFGTFSGRLPVFWKDDKILKDEALWPGLDVFRKLKMGGYDLNAYIATELEYRDMGRHFFSEPGELFSVLRDNRKDDPIFDKAISEREVMLFDDLKSRISVRSEGGHFDIVGLDSSHFYYTWHEDFTPPFTPFYERPYYLPPDPSDEELAQIKNKYYNSIAWCDYLVGDFIRFLKERGKYDESIVIVMGDHGEEFQDHGGWLHVSSLEEEQIRVPMLVKWPRSYGRGAVQKSASQLDILPSLLDYMTDGKQELDLPGNSLLEKNEQTVVAYTGMGGKTRDALVFIRGDYKAHFSWVDYWNWRPSNHIHLTQLYGPEGRITLGTNEQYLSRLKLMFPDVKERFFNRFGTKKLTWEEAEEGE